MAVKQTDYKNCPDRQFGVACTNISLGCRGVFYMSCKPINDTVPW